MTHPDAKPIATLPRFGIAKHGRYWLLIDMETKAHLGPTHNTKAEVLAYGYFRAEET